MLAVAWPSMEIALNPKNTNSIGSPFHNRSFPRQARMTVHGRLIPGLAALALAAACSSESATLTSDSDQPDAVVPAPMSVRSEEV